MDTYGFEIDENYYQIAEQRLKDIVRQNKTDLFK